MEAGKSVQKIETNLEKFKNSDILDSFFSGIWFGILILAFLGICAWLISVMRQRVYVGNRDITPKDLQDHQTNE